MLQYVIAFALSAAPARATTLPPAVSTTFRQDTTALRPYAGHYTFTDNNGVLSGFTVSLRNGEVFGQADGYPEYKLLKQADADTYQSTSPYGSTIRFTRDAAGRVTGLKLTIQGNELTAAKDK